MRKFARRLQERGFRVAYSRLDDPDTGPSIGAELLRRAAETGAREAVATRPGDWRLIEALEAMPLPVRFLPDDRFLCPADEFARWTEGRKQLRMEWFYREMRRRTGLPDGGGRARGREVELRHREPQARGARPAASAAAAVRARCRGARGTRPRRGALSAPFRAAPPVPLGHRPGRGASGARSLHPRKPAALRRRAGCDARRRSVPEPCAPVLVDEPRASRADGGLPPRRDRVARGPRAAERGRGLHPADPRLAGVCAGDLDALGAGLHTLERARPQRRPAAALLGQAHADGVPLRRGRPDPRSRLCPPHPAADGDGQFRAAGGRRSRRGARMVSLGLYRCAGMGRGAEHDRDEPVRRSRAPRLETLCLVRRLYRPDVGLLPRLRLCGEGPDGTPRLPPSTCSTGTS